MLLLTNQQTHRPGKMPVTYQEVVGDPYRKGTTNCSTKCASTKVAFVGNCFGNKRIDREKITIINF